MQVYLHTLTLAVSDNCDERAVEGKLWKGTKHAE